MQVELIEGFVGHPVANPGEPVLVEEEGLEGAAGMALQGGGGAGGGEAGAEDFRGQGEPGRGRAGGRLLKSDGAEHAGVAEDEGLPGGVEDEVVVGGGRVVGGAEEEFAGHAEVPGEPKAALEGEEEFFAVGAGAEVGPADEASREGRGGGVAEKARLGARVDAADDLALGGVPALSVVGDFGEFGHARRGVGKRNGRARKRSTEMPEGNCVDLGW